MNMRNFIKKHCWSCEYFSADNKCTITDLNKSKIVFVKMEIG